MSKFWCSGKVNKTAKNRNHKLS